MRRTKRLIAILTSGFFIAMFVVNGVMAGSFEIAPTTITLSAETGAGLFHVTNHGKEPIAIQVEALDWRQTANDGDQYETSSQLIVSPPILQLAAGQRQAVRLLANPSKGATEERAYRLLVSELPDAVRPPSLGVQMLLRFNVPVFYAGLDDKPATLAWTIQHTGQNLLVSAHNSGGRTAKLSQLTLSTESDQEISKPFKAIYYILPGMMRQWTVAWPRLSAEKKIRIKSYEERDNVPIDMLVPIKE